MDSDDLSAPLGQQRPKKRSKLPIAGPRVLVGVLWLFVLVVAGWIVFADNPLGGKPVPLESTLPERQTDVADGKDQTGTAFQQVTPPDAKIITIIDGSTGHHQNITILRPTPSLAPAR